MRHLHNGAELQHSRRAMLDGWLGDGTLVEEGDGAVYGFFSAFPLNCILGALAWVGKVSGSLRGCCRLRELEQSSVRQQHGRG